MAVKRRQLIPSGAQPLPAPSGGDFLTRLTEAFGGTPTTDEVEPQQQESALGASPQGVPPQTPPPTAPGGASPLRVGIDPSVLDGGEPGRPPIVVELPRSTPPDQIRDLALSEARKQTQSRELIRGGEIGGGKSLGFTAPPLTSGEKGSIVDPVVRVLPELAGFAQLIPQVRGAGGMMTVAKFLAPGIAEAVRQMLQDDEMSGGSIIARTALNAAPKLLAQGARIPQGAARGVNLTPSAIAAGGRHIKRGTELAPGVEAPSAGLPTITYAGGPTSVATMGMKVGEIGKAQGERLVAIVRKEGLTTNPASFERLTSRINALENQLNQVPASAANAPATRLLKQEIQDTYTLYGLLQQSRNKSYFGGGASSRAMAGASTGGLGTMAAAAMGFPQLASVVGATIGLPMAFANMSPGMALQASRIAEAMAKYGAPAVEGASRTGLTAYMAQPKASEKPRRRRVEPR